jgi:hypothetical protein
MSEINVIIEEKINKLIEEFNEYPEKFLTEEDVRSYLYHILLENFNIIHDCQDETRSIPIHCEVRWYGNSGNLKLRSDIVIIDVSSLRTQEKGGLKLPSKGYGFNQANAVIEIKLRRKGYESDGKFIEKIQKDRNKLNMIRDELQTEFNSYIIIFDKRKNINFQTHNTANHKEYYIFPYN